MKKAFCFLLLICILISAASCGNAAKPTDPAQTLNTTEPITTEQTEPQASIKQLPMAAVSVPTVTQSETAEDGSLIFQYTYQNMSLILQDPDVADKVIIDFLNRVDQTNETADSILSSAKTAYTPSETWIPYLCNITYSPMRIDQGVLSLFGTLVTYAGASHPERSCVSASYDLVTGDVLTLASIMSAEAQPDDFCDLTIDALKEIADAKYLYEGYAQMVRERFSGDASLDENWFFSQRGLCFYFAPYEIAPYAAGIITVEIPYEKLTGLLYDGYFPAERETASGKIAIAAFEETDMQPFTQIAEIVLQRNGQKVVLYTDGAAQDVRIAVSASESGTEAYTVFAAHFLTPGDAIVIEASAEQLADMKLSYLSDEQSVALPIQ